MSDDQDRGMEMLYEALLLIGWDALAIPTKAGDEEVDLVIIGKEERVLEALDTLPGDWGVWKAPIERIAH